MGKQRYFGREDKNIIVISIYAKNVNYKCPYLENSMFKLYRCTNERIIQQSNKLCKEEDDRVLYGCCGKYRNDIQIKNIE